MRGSTKPLCSTIPVVQSCSKSSVKAAATSLDSTIATTFSCTENESFVQFIEPVQTALAVAHDVLVVHEVGHARDRLVRDAERRDQLRVGLGRRRHGDRVAVADVVDDPHRDAARVRRADRAADDLRGLVEQVEVVVRQVERALRAREEFGDRLRDLDGGLAALAVRAELDQASIAVVPPRRGPAASPNAAATTKGRMSTIGLKLVWPSLIST